MNLKITLFNRVSIVLRFPNKNLTLPLLTPFPHGCVLIFNLNYRTKTTNLPYYSWSHLLADLIESTQKDLCNIISQPQSVGCTLSLLQCLAIFLSSTPYHRMNNGILKAAVQALNPLLRHAGNIESCDYFNMLIRFSFLINYYIFRFYRSHGRDQMFD